MGTSSIGKALTWLALITGVAYLLAGVIGGLLPSHWEGSPTSDRVAWFVLLIAGGLLVLGGLRLFPRSPWGGAALVSLGGLLGALVLFWTVAALIAAIALIVLSVVQARRTAATT